MLCGFLAITIVRMLELIENLSVRLLVAAA